MREGGGNLKEIYKQSRVLPFFKRGALRKRITGLFAERGGSAIWEKNPQSL